MHTHSVQDETSLRHKLSELNRLLPKGFNDASQKHTNKGIGVGKWIKTTKFETRYSLNIQ